MTVHLIPRLDGEFSESAGFSVDDTWTKSCVIEKDLQPYGVVASGFHLERGWE
jgi:hypothetical protein